jgi:hypothetical protein
MNTFKRSCMNPMGSLTLRAKKFHQSRLLFHALLAAAALAVRANALTIVPVYDSSITGIPEGPTIIATIQSALDLYDFGFSDPVVVTINFQNMNGGLGQSSAFVVAVPYTDYVHALRSHVNSLDDAGVITALPLTTGNPVNGHPLINLKLPLARALGFSAAPPPSQPDGTISLNLSIMNLSSAQTDPTKFSLFSVVCHEIDEVLAFDSALNGLNNGDPSPAGPISPEDLFRFDASGARSFTTSLSASSFFSIDGTATLARFNQNARGDFSDWSSIGSPAAQVQDAFGTPGTSPVPDVEFRVLDIVGFNRAQRITWVDFALPCFSCGSGTFNDPFNTLYRGELAADNGGTVIIKAGTSTEQLPLTINKPLHIMAFGGCAMIGPGAVCP